MWKPEIPEWEKKYLYFALAAIGLVLMFSWGQIQFFTAGQLNTGSSYSSGNDSYTSSAFRSNNSALNGGPSVIRKKNTGFFPGIQRTLARYRAFREIARLQRLAEQTDDPETRARIEAEIGDQYAYVIGDDPEARTYYVRAISRGGTTVLTSRRAFSPEEKVHMSAPSFSFGAMGRSLAHYFSKANPYDIRTSRVQIMNDTEERAREFEPDTFKDAGTAGDMAQDEQGDVPLRRKELDSIVNDLIMYIVNKDTRRLRSFIPDDGVRCGESVEVSVVYSKKEAQWSLWRKKGPVYDALIGGIRDAGARADQVSYLISDGEDLSGVQLSYPNTVPEDLQNTQQLYLQRTKKHWGIVFIGK